MNTNQAQHDMPTFSVNTPINKAIFNKCRRCEREARSRNRRGSLDDLKTM